MIKSLNKFDAVKYLQETKLLHHLNSKPTEQLLNDITAQHVYTFYYHNCGIFRTKNIMDLSLEQIQVRLVDQKQGGMCYEVCELLFNALIYFEFDVIRVPSYVLNKYETDLDRPSNHNILVVKIVDQFFLIDAGFGYNSIRQPLKVQFDKTEIIITKQSEKYELQCLDTYYQLGMEINGEIWPFYRFNKQSGINLPETVNEQDTIRNYHNLINYEKCQPIRDYMIKIGRVTPLKRIGCTYDPETNKFQKIEFSNQLTEKTTYDNCDDFLRDVQEIYNFSLSKTLFENY